MLVQEVVAERKDGGRLTGRGRRGGDRKEERRKWKDKSLRKRDELITKRGRSVLLKEEVEEKGRKYRTYGKRKQN